MEWSGRYSGREKNKSGFGLQLHPLNTNMNVSFPTKQKQNKKRSANILYM